MNLKNASEAAKQIRELLQAKSLPVKAVSVVVCDQGCRIDVRTEAITKVRQALPLKVNGVAVIVVP